MRNLFFAAALVISVGAQAQTPAQVLNGLVGCYDLTGTSSITGDVPTTDKSNWKVRIRLSENKNWMSPAPSPMQTLQVIAGPLAPETKNFEVIYEMNQEIFLNAPESLQRIDENGNLVLSYEGTVENHIEKVSYDDTFFFIADGDDLLVATRKSWIQVRGDHPTEGFRRVLFGLKRASCQ